jgi:hypothetical protein
MNKIYYVMIKGRTLESRNIKHLLARAVAEKRNLDRKTNLSTSITRCTTMNSIGPCYRDSW